MTTLNPTLPNSLQRHLQEMADLDGVPVEQFVMSAVAEKISALTAEVPSVFRLPRKWSHTT